MKVEGRLDGFGSRPLSGGTTVEAFAATGKLPDLFPGQRLNATIMSVNGQNALVDLKGASVVLAGLPGFKPGMELSIQVSQVAPRLLLDVAPRLTKLSPQLPPLAVGQKVSAEVIEELAGETVLVNVLGVLLEAESPKTVRPGATFTARVEQLQPRVVLHILSQADEEADAVDGQSIQAEAARLMRANLPHQTTAADSLNSLTQEIASFVEHPPQDLVPSSILKLQTLIKTLLPEQTSPTAEHLATFVRDGGLQYEAKLLRLVDSTPQSLSQAAEQDLKGLLLQALKDLEIAQTKADSATQEPSTPLLAAEAERAVTEEVFPDIPHPASRDIITSLTHHLENIESQQAVNLLAQVKGEPYQLQIPFFTSQGMTTAFLSIESEGQGNEGQGRKETARKGRSILFFSCLTLKDSEKRELTRGLVRSRYGWLFTLIRQTPSLSYRKNFPSSVKRFKPSDTTKC